MGRKIFTVKALLGMVIAVLLFTLPASAVTYTYDSLNRLTSATYDNGQTVSYTYDAGGNITSVSTTSNATTIVANASDNVVSLNTGNLSINSANNTWVLEISNATVKDVVSNSDLTITNLPDEFTAVVSKGAENSLIVTVSGDLQTPLAEQLTVTIVVKATAVTQEGMANSDPIAVTIKTAGAFIVANDAEVVMADGNQEISTEDNTWLLTVSDATLRENISVDDLSLVGLPAGLVVSVSQPGNQILLTVSGTAKEELTDTTDVQAYVKESAFVEQGIGNSNKVSLKLVVANCFIATAAYGSYLDPHVRVLRQFRDEVLTKSSFGRWFIQEYYQYSPGMATVIRQHSTLKTGTAFLLTPIVFTIKYPIAATIIILILIIPLTLKRLTQ